MPTTNLYSGALFFQEVHQKRPALLFYFLRLIPIRSHPQGQELERLPCGSTYRQAIFRPPTFPPAYRVNKLERRGRTPGPNSVLPLIDKRFSRVGVDCRQLIRGESIRRRRPTLFDHGDIDGSQPLQSKEASRVSFAHEHGHLPFCLRIIYGKVTFQYASGSPTGAFFHIRRSAAAVS